MAGTIEGGKKAAATNRLRFGADYYEKLGKMGGSSSREGGFATDTVGKDGRTGRERARIVGAIGGKISRRPSRV